MDYGGKSEIEIALMMIVPNLNRMQGMNRPSKLLRLHSGALLFGQGSSLIASFPAHEIKLDETRVYARLILGPLLD